MAEPEVPLVEQLREATVQPLDSVRELDSRRVEHEVVVGRHQAERVNGPVVALDANAYVREEHPSVGVVSDDGAAIDPARDHMEVAVWECRSEHPWHGSCMKTPPAVHANPCGRIGTLSSHLPPSRADTSRVRPGF